MNRSEKILIIISISAVFVCSVVVALSESGNVTSVSEEVSSENIPRGQVMLPALTSQEEAMTLADQFLKETLGDEFFQTRFTFVEIEERPDLSTWFIVYAYASNEYTVEMKVAVNAGRIPEDRPRVDAEFSRVLLEPQEILISADKVKAIAQENRLEPPYKELTLSCERMFHRICWIIVKDDAKIAELEGLVIDAENGTVLESWINWF